MKDKNIIPTQQERVMREDDFSVSRTRICGQTETEVRHLLGTQSFE